MRSEVTGINVAARIGSIKRLVDTLRGGGPALPKRVTNDGQNASGEATQYHFLNEAARILVVDDEKVIREILADFLAMEGYWVRTAEDGQSALAELSKHPYDMVITDLKMPRMGGLELLEAVGAEYPNVCVVIMTGFGTVETAIDAMKKGAYDYVLKPFKVEEVVQIVQRGLEKQRLAAEKGATVTSPLPPSPGIAWAGAWSPLRPARRP